MVILAISKTDLALNKDQHLIALSEGRNTLGKKDEILIYTKGVICNICITLNTSELKPNPTFTLAD